MKHIFVINPKAGKDNKVEEIQNTLKDFDGFEYEIYVTKSKGDAKGFVKNYLETHDDSVTYRFYACGGDGTLHDVSNGAYGFKNAEVACYACGSGNDFVKNFKDRVESFTDLKKIIQGTSQEIDLLKVNDRLSVNIVNCGFDGDINYMNTRLRKLPLIKGTLAYNLAVFVSLLFKMSSQMKVVADDELVFNGKSLLAVCANGFCYGGGYYCAPKAEITDGKLDLCFIKKISRFKAAPLIKIYKKGDHLDSPKLKGLITYKQCKKITIETAKPVGCSIDGEVYKLNKYDIEILPKALKFVVPII